MAEAVAFFSGQLDVDPTPAQWDEQYTRFGAYEGDYADFRGQEMLKRALTIVAVGDH